MNQIRSANSRLYVPVRHGHNSRYAAFKSLHLTSRTYGVFCVAILVSFATVGYGGLGMSYGSLDDGPSGQIFVLNPQSYPVVGSHWTVQFTTVGNYDLVVFAVNETTFERDLVFVELYSSNGTAFVPSDVQNNTLTFANFTGMTGENSRGGGGGGWRMAF